MNFSVFTDDDTFGAVDVGGPVIFDGYGTASVAFSTAQLKSAFIRAMNAGGFGVTSATFTRTPGTSEVTFKIKIPRRCDSDLEWHTGWVRVGLEGIDNGMFNPGSVVFFSRIMPECSGQTVTPTPTPPRGNTEPPPRETPDPPGDPNSFTEQLKKFFKEHETEAIIGAGLLLVLLLKK